METTSVPGSLISGELLGSIPERASLRHSYRLLAVVTFLCVSCLVAYRITSRLDPSGQSRELAFAHADFRDGVYYPVVSFLRGGNPYDGEEFLRRYPVKCAFPPYLPLTLLYHLPLGFLSFAAASYTYLAWMLALVVALAYLALRVGGLTATMASVFGLAAVMLVSRPGYWTLYIGQYSVTVVVGVYLALLFRGRAGFGPLGVALAAMKPSYGVPLALLMFARGEEYRGAAIRGWLYAAAISSAILAGVIHNVGLNAFVAAATSNYDWFSDNPEVNPATSSYRVDVVALLSRALGEPLGTAGEVLIFAAIIGLSAVAIRRLANVRAEGTTQLVVALICLAILACTYHQSYDVIVLAAPLAALVSGRWAPRPWAASGWRWFLTALLAFPMFNYLTSQRVFQIVGTGGAPWLFLSSLNGVVLLLALLTYATIAFRVGAAAAEGGTVCAPQR